MIDKKIIFLIAASFLLAMSGESQAETATNRAETKFVFDETPMVPVDPTKPSEEIELAGENPSKGPLSIGFTTDIQFGNKKIENEDALYYAELATVTRKVTKEKVNVPNFVQINDNTGGGWTLYVSQSKEFVNQDGFKLKGATLSFNNTTLKNLDGIGIEPMKKNQQIKLDNVNERYEIVAAEKGTGIGMWNIQFGEDINEASKSIGLTVPKGTPKKNGVYNTVLEWTLVQGP